MDNFSQCEPCITCAKPVPTELHKRNAGECGLCACTTSHALDHVLHRELELHEPMAPVVPQMRQ